MQVSIDDLTNLKYLITERLVENGLIPDCTDNDQEHEVNCENSIQEIFEEFFNITFN